MSNNVFIGIGLFTVSALSFAFITACCGGVITDFDKNDWSIFAWFMGGYIIWYYLCGYVWYVRSEKHDIKKVN